MILVLEYLLCRYYDKTVTPAELHKPGQNYGTYKYGQEPTLAATKTISHQHQTNYVIGEAKHQKLWKSAILIL